MNKQSDLPRPILSGCNVNPVDGLVWNEEVVGSNPTTQTTNIIKLIVLPIAVWLSYKLSLELWCITYGLINGN